MITNGILGAVSAVVKAVSATLPNWSMTLPSNLIQNLQTAINISNWIIPAGALFTIASLMAGYYTAMILIWVIMKFVALF